MNHLNKRRTFLKTSFLTLGGVVTLAPLMGNTSIKTKTMQEKKEPIKSDLVREFVIAGHGNLEKVKEMLMQEPNLVNATWDWGAGDFETALGGAGHMGRADIAEFLISKGARMDIFCAAMLGKIDVVKSILIAYPDLKLSRGPHGITLLQHARKGEERAKSVLDYLTEIGAS